MFRGRPHDCRPRFWKSLDSMNVLSQVSPHLNWIENSTSASLPSTKYISSLMFKVLEVVLQTLRNSRTKNYEAFYAILTEDLMFSCEAAATTLTVSIAITVMEIKVSLHLRNSELIIQLCWKHQGDVNCVVLNLHLPNTPAQTLRSDCHLEIPQLSWISNCFSCSPSQFNFMFRSS